MQRTHTIIAVPLKPALYVTLAAVALVIATSGLQGRFGANVAQGPVCTIIDGDVSLLPQPFDPTRSPLAIRVPLKRPAADAVVTVRSGETVIASMALDVTHAAATGIWNGRDVYGAIVPADTYALDLVVRDPRCSETRSSFIAVHPTMHAYVLLQSGETLQLGATLPDDDRLLPAGAWMSSDAEVLSIDANGLATAKKPGEVTVVRSDGGTPVSATQPIAIQVR